MKMKKLNMEVINKHFPLTSKLIQEWESYDRDYIDHDVFALRYFFKIHNIYMGCGYAFEDRTKDKLAKPLTFSDLVACNIMYCYFVAAPTIEYYIEKDYYESSVIYSIRAAERFAIIRALGILEKRLKNG